MMKTHIAIFVLLGLLLPTVGQVYAGPGGCADCGDEEICTDCREFYAEIARKVPEKGARVWGWVLGGLTSIAFIGVFIHVVRGDRRSSVLRVRARRHRSGN